MDNSLPIEQRVDANFPVREIAADGRVFSYRMAGEGPMLVLLHGIGSGSGSWFHQLHGLADRYRMVAWDAPGYGRTTPLEAETPGAGDYAAALKIFLTALEIQPEVIIGHSLGALMAGGYVAAYKPSLRALILADPANGYGAADEAIRLEKMNARLAMVNELGPAGMAESRSSNLLSANASDEALALVRWNMSQIHPEGYRQATRMLAHGHLIGDAVDYDGPVLVMGGSEDIVTPEAACRDVAAAFRNSEYSTLPGVGHASYVENGKQFNNMVLSFLVPLYG
jgi:pimeloyl-ACP methyl ester carboxylesterase